jgi:hypothetical protein
MSTFLYTELYHDDCQRANENPLDPSNWVERGGDVLELLNHLITTTVAVSADGTARYKPVLPNNQYAEIVVSEMLLNDTGMFIYLRSGVGQAGPSPVAPTYILDIGNFDNPGPGTAPGLFGVYQVDPTGGSIVYSWVGNEWPDITFQTGDVVRFGVYGDYATGTLFFDYNGVNIWTGNLADSSVFLPSGSAGLQIACNVGDVNAASISRWAAGSVQIAPPSAGTVSGNVVASGAIVECVSDHFDSSKTRILFTVSDAKGNYSFSGLTIGNYYVDAFAPGFVYRSRVSVTVDGVNGNTDINLVPSAANSWNGN